MCRHSSGFSSATRFQRMPKMAARSSAEVEAEARYFRSLPCGPQASLFVAWRQRQQETRAASRERGLGGGGWGGRPVSVRACTPRKPSAPAASYPAAAPPPQRSAGTPPRLRGCRKRTHHSCSEVKAGPHRQGDSGLFLQAREPRHGATACTAAELVRSPHAVRSSAEFLLGCARSALVALRVALRVPPRCPTPRRVGDPR